MKRVKLTIFSILAFLLLPQLSWAVPAIALPLPAIRTISPTTSTAGPQSIVISGKNFINVTSVNIYNAVNGTMGGQAQLSCQYTVDSVSKITAGVTLKPGSYYLQVATSYGATNSQPLTVTAPTSTTPTTKTLAPGPFQVQDLGALVESATIEGAQQYTSSQNHETHFLLYYLLKNCQQIPFQIMDVNLDRGEVRVVDAVLGRPAPLGGFVPHPNGKIYIATGNAGSTAGGYLMSYDPVTGQAQTLGMLADNNGAQNVIVGDDGAIYLGECIKGYVERYDPKTGAWENYGIIDDPGPPYYRYAYTLGSDGRYIYIAIGQMPWYLVVYDRVNRTQQVYWKDSGLSNCSVLKATDGHWYAKTIFPDGTRYYKLNGDSPPEKVAIPPTTATPLYYSYYNSNYQANIDDAYPDTSNNGTAVLKYKLKSESTWRQIAAQVRIGPIDIKRLYNFDENKFFGFTSSYGPVFNYDPILKKTTVLGRPGASLYDALILNYNDLTTKGFLAGYPSLTMVWDPVTPWKVNTSNLYDPLYSPHQLTFPPEGTGKYHFYLAEGADGLVYVGEHHERDSVGGSIGWYNPKTGQAGGLRTPFLQYDVNDLVALQNSRQLVFSGYSLQSGTNGQLFIFNVDLKQVVDSIAPLPGSQDPGKIIEVSPGVVLGVVKPKSGGSVSRIYKVNLTTGKVLFNQEIAGVAFGGKYYSDSRLVMGPDGFVWLYVDNNVCRINPADGSLEKVASSSPPGGVLFNGNDLYIYGGDTLRQIPQLFVP